MARTFRLMTDSSADLTKEMIKATGVTVLPLTLTLDDGKVTVPNNDVDEKEIYARLRAKEVIRTSAVSMQAFLDAFGESAANGEDVLYIGFSSALSVTYLNAKNAAEEVSAVYPQRKIIVLDSFCASLGQGLLVYLTAKYADENDVGIKEASEYANDLKMKICHEFTVDDLFFLHRGGRVNAATAVLGTMLAMKPVMHMSDEGKLVGVGKVRGRLASLSALCDKLVANIQNPSGATVFICHGDCIEDAEKLAQMIRDRAGVDDIQIGYVGAVIGSHAGPGVVSVFFVAEHR